MKRPVVYGIILLLASGLIAAVAGLATLLSSEASPYIRGPTPTPLTNWPVEPAPTPVPAGPGPTSIPKPVPTPDQPIADPEPWPPEEVREEIIALALNDPQTRKILEGHRYRVSGVTSFYDKSGPCASTGSFPPPLNCFQVGIYDYTVPTGVVVTVNFQATEVVDRSIEPGYQPPTLKEEFDEITQIIAADPRFGPSVEVVPAYGKLVFDTDLGGNCGGFSPLHRCLLVFVRQEDGESSSVTVDMVDEKVVRIRPN